MNQKKFNFYIKKVEKEIEQIVLNVKKKEGIKKNKQEDMLLELIINKEETNIYNQIHLTSMMCGKIWEIVFFNFEGWERLKKGADGISHSRKIILELKNKSTTLNHTGLEGTLSKKKNLKKNILIISLFWVLLMII